MRIDKYLKVSRLIKRRSIASAACDAGRVTINGKVAKPSANVSTGDRITITFGTRALNIIVDSINFTSKKEEAIAMYTIEDNNG